MARRRGWGEGFATAGPAERYLFVNFLDLLLIVIALAALTGGWQAGLLTRAGGWIGAGIGLAVAFVTVGPMVDLMADQGQQTRLAVAILVPVVLAAAGQSLGLVVGSQLQRTLPEPLKPLDRTGGALAGVLSVGFVVWLLLPTLGLIPGAVSRAARGSAIVSLIDEVAPPPPDSLHELAQEVAEFPFPQVFDDMRSSPDAGTPPADLALPAEVATSLVSSTMNIESPGCGGILEGSGFVVEPGLVVTNAHVVAGTVEHEVVLDDGSRLKAVVVTYDADRDLALLQVDGLDRAPIPLAEPTDGEGVAVFGYPEGQDSVRIAPGSVAGIRTAVGRDIYGTGEVSREILIMAAGLRHGDSGSAVVNARGEVVGVAFAIAPDRASTAYALDTSELAEVLAAPRDPRVPTGPCT